MIHNKMHKSRRLIERYKLKLHVNFHQISLNVKFSCKIALALKNQDSTHQSIQIKF